MTVFMHRLFAVRPCKPRNPLLRVLCGMVGVALLAMLVIVGLFVGLAMLLFAALRRMLRPAPAAAPQPQVIEGEYAVVRPQPVSLPQH
jgi:hypothetical protein